MNYIPSIDEYKYKPFPCIELGPVDSSKLPPRVMDDFDISEHHTNHISDLYTGLKESILII